MYRRQLNVWGEFMDQTIVIEHVHVFSEEDFSALEYRLLYQIQNIEDCDHCCSLEYACGFIQDDNQLSLF